MKTLPSQKNPWGFIQKSVGNLVDNNSNSHVNYVEFNLTGRCEGGCITCPTIEKYRDEKAIKTKQDLTNELENFKQMLTKLKSLGMNVLSLYGREPVLWDKEAIETNSEKNYFLKDLINWASNDLSVKVCLLSSGLDLDVSLLKNLFDKNGILFMKNWGSKKSYDILMKHKNAYEKNQKSWELVKKTRKEYDKTRVIAEFLYTGINRKDLLEFWEKCLKDNILPFVEVPTIRGDCIKTYGSLKIDLEDYIKDIYELSLLNISLLYNIDLEEVKKCDFWYPPYGSVFPMQCNKLTKGKGIFLDRNGDISICSGLPIKIGNINDLDIKEKLSNSKVISNTRQIYTNLKGWCKNCKYSNEMNTCYGCRGNAYTYDGQQSAFSQDPMCFGKVALKLGEKKLRKFMSDLHTKKLNEYFGDTN